MKSAILIYSGGLDSTVLLYYLLRKEFNVRCLSINYGQRHARELAAAAEIAQLTDVEHRTVSLPSVRELLAGSSQTDANVPVPTGHYEDESMKATVVPNRNMIMLSLAIGWAVSTRSDCVAFAVHRGDRAIYLDCRAEFVAAMNAVSALCDEHAVRVLAPFLQFDKQRIVSEGIKLGAPLHLTWTCYNGGEVSCGVCGSCGERREAFAKLGVEDPLTYEV